MLNSITTTLLFNYIDDPSVLLEAETEFLDQMFGDQNEICVDKENIPPNTPMPGKPCSKKNKKTKPLSPKSKGPTKRKSKDSEQSKAKKTKKVYSKG